MTGGDLPQLAIGQFHQARFGIRLAIPEGPEKTGYLAITRALHYGSLHHTCLLKARCECGWDQLSAIPPFSRHY
jgi:hypothetical protein